VRASIAELRLVVFWAMCGAEGETARSRRMARHHRHRLYVDLVSPAHVRVARLRYINRILLPVEEDGKVELVV
jgi:hypothetical protein